MPRPIYLIDPSTTKVATLDVRRQEDRFEGKISLDATPAPLKRLFEQFEEIVEGQVFSLLDDIEEKIETSGLRVLLDDGSKAEVVDLQVFPSTDTVSFKTRQPTEVR